MQATTRVTRWRARHWRLRPRHLRPPDWRMRKLTYREVVRRAEARVYPRSWRGVGQCYRDLIRATSYVYFTMKIGRAFTWRYTTPQIIAEDRESLRG